MSQTTNNKERFRFSWSHQAAAHRIMVKTINKILNLIPFSIKYGVGKQLRKSHPPYNLIKGKTVIQIGSPFDTLAAGRSRGMYFSLFAGIEGKSIIVEPAPISVEAFNQQLKKRGIKNTTVYWSGAWSEKGTTQLLIDESHPATNFTEGTVDYDKNRLDEYKKIEVPVDTVDNIIKALDLEDVFLISTTTNWAELEILEGMKETIAKGLPFICLAYGNPDTDYDKLMDGLGYDFYSHDDRGITYKQRKT